MNKSDAPYQRKDLANYKPRRYPFTLPDSAPLRPITTVLFFTVSDPTSVCINTPPHKSSKATNLLLNSGPKDYVVLRLSIYTVPSH